MVICDREDIAYYSTEPQCQYHPTDIINGSYCNVNMRWSFNHLLQIATKIDVSVKLRVLIRGRRWRDMMAGI
jgi:hypothetical protein